jgi:hypothetical protein
MLTLSCPRDVERQGCQIMKSGRPKVESPVTLAVSRAKYSSARPDVSYSETAWTLWLGWSLPALSGIAREKPRKSPHDVPGLQVSS